VSDIAAQRHQRLVLRCCPAPIWPKGKMARRRTDRTVSQSETYKRFAPEGSGYVAGQLKDGGVARPGPELLALSWAEVS